VLVVFLANERIRRLITAHSGKCKSAISYDLRALFTSEVTDGYHFKGDNIAPESEASILTGISGHRLHLLTMACRS
jgi:hypothetical protein